MADYQNRRLHLSFAEIVSAILIIALLLGAGYFVHQHNETEDEFNISRTEVDYILMAPSREQIASLTEVSGVSRVVPYFYRSVVCKGVNTSLYIIEQLEDLPYTVFSDELRIGSMETGADNPLFLSQDLADSAELKISDSVDISVNGNTVRFTVCGMYRSDHRQNGGMMITVLKNDTEKALTANRDAAELKYSGAYVCCQDNSSFPAYLDSYMPEGDLRTRDEFESDELYNAYLENRKLANRSNAFFSTAAYLSELSKRYETRLKTTAIIPYAFLAIAVLIAAFTLFIRSNHYYRTDLLKDIRNNFTMGQEMKMLVNYSGSYIALLLASSLAAFALGMLIWKNEIFSPYNIICLASITIGVLVSYMFSRNKLNSCYSTGVDETGRKMTVGDRA